MSFNAEFARLECAERQLTLMQTYFPRIDNKVSTLFTVASAETAIAVLNVGPTDLQVWYIAVPLAMFLGTISAIVSYLYRCTYPHLTYADRRSLVYFGEIALRSEPEYVEAYGGSSPSELTDDISGQIWHNAKILVAKFRYLKAATVYAMVSIVPWALFLLAESVTHARVPVVH